MSFKDGPAKLYQINFAEGLQGDAEVERLVSQSMDDQSPAWSPNGQFVAFSSKQNGDYEIYAINLLDQSLVQLTDSAGHDQYPAWQP